MSPPSATKPRRTAISPTRAEDYPEWYQQVVRAGELAESSPVRGCMVIKPWGYGLWETIRATLDRRFKATGHRNAYFPLFIPLSHLQQEADHVEGFAKECAVVTHHRLEAGPDGVLVPAGKLEEPLVVRPTSETIIGVMFSRWIESHRDLPLLINQWANVVRWEMRPRLFLRTTEFLWQEGHTAHATAAEAEAEMRQMLDIYADFARNAMAMPVIKGRKTDAERFPGAVETCTIEAMMQDGKALQAGTSHFLGQNFATAQAIRFQAESGELEHAWTTSWGVSTRLVGAMVMVHGDDDGLVLPPRLAPVQVAILPITFNADDPEAVLNYCHKLADDLRVIPFHGRSIEVEIDDRDQRGGEKVWSWIKRGVPLRLEVGQREMAADRITCGRRDQPHDAKETMPRPAFIEGLTAILDQVQHGMYERASTFLDEHTHRLDSVDEITSFLASDEMGFVLAHWSGDPAVEAQVKETTGATIRCMPLDDEEGAGTCPFTGNPSPQRVVWAKGY